MTPETALEWLGLLAMFVTSCLASLGAVLVIAATIVWLHNRTAQSVDDEANQ